MIEIKPDEAHELQARFADFTDRDIIRELVRRGRLRQHESSGLFYREMRDEPHYMDSVKSGLLARVVRKIADDPKTKPALITERYYGANPWEDNKLSMDDTNGASPSMLHSVLVADIVYLVARDKKEG